MSFQVHGGSHISNLMFANQLQQREHCQCHASSKRAPRTELGDSHFEVKLRCVHVLLGLGYILSSSDFTAIQIPWIQIIDRVKFEISLQLRYSRWKTLCDVRTPCHESECDENCRRECHETCRQTKKRIQKEAQKRCVQLLQRQARNSVAPSMNGIWIWPHIAIRRMNSIQITCKFPGSKGRTEGIRWRSENCNRISKPIGRQTGRCLRSTCPSRTVNNDHWNRGCDRASERLCTARESKRRHARRSGST